MSVMSTVDGGVGVEPLELPFQLSLRRGQAIRVCDAKDAAEAFLRRLQRSDFPLGLFLFPDAWVRATPCGGSRFALWLDRNSISLVGCYASSISVRELVDDILAIERV